MPVAVCAALLCAPVLGTVQSILLTVEDFTLLGGTGITSTGTNDQEGNVTAIPEPSTYAALFGVAMLGFVFVRRLRGSRKA